MILPSDPKDTVNLTVVLAVIVAGVGLAVRIVVGRLMVRQPVESKSNTVK